MKAYAQAVRHQVYQLFDSLLAKHRDGELIYATVCSRLSFQEYE